MKRKFLAKAITLGLLLAVPLGAQAEYIDDADNYINESSQGWTVLYITGNVEKSVKDTITITNTNSSGGNAIVVGASATLSLTADTINITAKGNQALYIENGSTANINGNQVVIDSKGSLSNKGTFNINVGNENLKSDSRIEINNTIGNKGKLEFISNSMNLAEIVADNTSNTNLTATTGDIVSTGGLKFNNSSVGTINATNGKLEIKTSIDGIRANDKAQVTVKAKQLEITTDTEAIHAYRGGNITINSDDVSITSKNEEDPNRFNKGIDVGGECNLTINATNKVEINSGISITDSVNSQTSSSIKIDAGREIKIKGDIKTTADDENPDIIGANITIGSAESNAKITIDGDIYRGQLKNADGDVIANNAGGSVNIILNNSESSLTGNIYDKDASDGDAGSVNLEVNNGATWTTTGDSTVKEVRSNGGVIDLAGTDQKVDIKKITSDGTSNQGTTIKTDSIDNKLTIGSNNSKLDVVASGKVTDSIGNDIQGGMKKLLNNIDIKDGTKETTVKAEAGAVTGETTISRDESGNTSAAVEGVNKYNAGISEMASIGLMAWRAENNDMNKRLGELRSSKGEHGVWTRMVRGQSKYGAQGIKNQYSTYQLGYDEKLSVDKHWTVGAAVSYTDASSSFTTGHGENKSTGLAVYGSYLGDNGSFVDLIAKVARLKNEFDVMGGAGKGDYETNGYSLSAEYGKRFTKDNGFWIEPQVELTYGYVGAVDYLTSNDVSVRQNGMDSLVGRIGFSVGRDIKAGNVYARASYLYDFDGETDVTFSNGNATRSFKQDLGGGWWEVGVGTNLNLSEATHLYFDVEKTYSGNVATPWQWNAGVRWSF